jgi:hypothetical protein
MLNYKTELVGISAKWIRNLPEGGRFRPSDLYKFLERNHPDKIDDRGDAATEPRYKNDARWATQEALGNGLVVRRARGVYERTSTPIARVVL